MKILEVPVDKMVINFYSEDVIIMKFSQGV